MSTENTPPPARNKHKSINAVALYNKLIELLTLVPATKDWQEETLKSEPAKYYRLLQLKGMVKAFGVESIEHLMNGEFIAKNDPSKYKAIIDLIKARALMNDYSLLNRWGIKKYLNTNIFSDKKKMLLDDYNYCMEQLLVEVFVDGKGGVQNLRKDYQSLNMYKERLAKYVSPYYNRGINVGTLIEKYNCPDVDVLAFDDEKTKNIFEDEDYRPHYIINGLKVMQQYFLLLKMEPHVNLWKEEMMHHDKIKHDNLMRLIALLKAFEIDSIEDFLSGNFLLKRDMRRYTGYYNSIFSGVRTAELEHYLQVKIDNIVDHQKMLEQFTRAFKFCVEMEDLKKIENTDESVDRFYHLSIDEVSDIINPERERISYHRLVTQFGYPK